MNATPPYLARLVWPLAARRIEHIGGDAGLGGSRRKIECAVTTVSLGTVELIQLRDAAPAAGT